MKYTETEIQGLLILEPTIHGDERGYFFESYSKRVSYEFGLKNDFVQDNESSSGYGVLRGLHYQVSPMGMAKLLRVTKGEILDIAVDIRKGSKTFGQHHSVILSEENKKQFFIPRGFAHGFATLSKLAVVNYKCDNYYSKEHETGIMWNDPDLNIDWRISPQDMILSEKDQHQLSFVNYQPYE